MTNRIRRNLGDAYFRVVQATSVLRLLRPHVYSPNPRRFRPTAFRGPAAAVSFAAPTMVQTGAPLPPPSPLLSALEVAGGATSSRWTYARQAAAHARVLGEKATRSAATVTCAGRRWALRPDGRPMLPLSDADVLGDGAGAHRLHSVAELDAYLLDRLLLSRPFPVRVALRPHWI